MSACRRIIPALALLLAVVCAPANGADAPSRPLLPPQLCLGAPDGELAGCAQSERRGAETRLTELTAAARGRLQPDDLGRLEATQRAWQDSLKPYCELALRGRGEGGAALYRGNADLCIAIQTQQRLLAMRALAGCTGQELAACWTSASQQPVVASPTTPPAR
jgi:uncharacterized protein YecT (DUF1311 family)